ncbi:hypothetical protein LBMAG24_17650 [Bacteroidota bacterium]|nr:hypothetical protein LBMAG24_17650 [Bacteroidota bacterium]
MPKFRLNKSKGDDKRYNLQFNAMCFHFDIEWNAFSTFDGSTSSKWSRTGQYTYQL